MNLIIQGDDFLSDEVDWEEEGKKLRGKSVDFDLGFMTDQSMKMFKEWVEKYDIKITSLEIRDSNIYSLPFQSLPDCVEFFCQETILKSLPDMPNCIIFTCRGCSLEKLPKLPKCESVDCSFNSLTFIDNLMNARNLNCQNNFLTYISNIPKVETLNCSNNINLTTIYGEMQLKTVEMENTDIDHRTTFIHSNLLEIFTPLNKYIRFKPAKDLIEKGITFESIQESLHEFDYDQIVNIGLETTDIPQYMLQYIVKDVDNLVKMATLWFGATIERYYLHSLVDNEIVNKLEEKYHDEIKPNWDIYTVVEFLVSKYDEELIQSFTSQIESEVYRMKTATMDNIHTLFQNIIYTYNQQHDDKGSQIKFAAMMQNFESRILTQYFSKFDVIIKKVIEEAKKEFMKNLVEIYEGVEKSVNPEEPNPKKRKREEDEDERPSRRRRI